MAIFVLNGLGLCVLCSLPLGLGLGFGDTVNASGSLTRAKDSMDLTFLWGKEQGNIILKNILAAGNTEKLVMGVLVNQPEGVKLPLVAVAPMGENSGRAVVGMVRGKLK
jgi:hypothetical protein